MNETFGERLKRLRSKKELSAAEMAKLIDVAQTTYREWEYGRGLRNLPPFLKISQVLAVSVTELVTGEEPSISGHLQELEDLEKRLSEIRRKLLAMT